MVVDPWPDLFQEMIELSAFYSCMPRDICLVIAHDAMPNWIEAYKQQMEAWKSEGRRILIFDHPYTVKLPEIQELYKTLDLPLPDLYAPKRMKWK